MSGLRNLSRYTLIAITTLGAYSVARADVIVGNWEDTTGDGWIDWNNQKLINPPSTDVSANGANNRVAYQFVTAGEAVTESSGGLVGQAVTLGTHALMVVPGRTTANSGGTTGFIQGLALKLQSVNSPDIAASTEVADFMANKFFSIDMTVPGDAVSTSGFQQFFQLAINTDLDGFASQPPPPPDVSFGFPNGNTRTVTLTWDYSQIVADYTTAGTTPAFAELVFATNSDSANHNTYFFDNARLSLTAPTPEPTSLGLIGIISAAILSRRRL